MFEHFNWKAEGLNQLNVILRNLVKNRLTEGSFYSICGPKKAVGLHCKKFQALTSGTCMSKTKHIFLNKTELYSLLHCISEKHKMLLFQREM